MFGGRNSGRLIGLAVLATVLVPACAHAAWLGYKNNTTAVVVIQAADIVVVNGKAQQVRPGKPHALYPGEVAWDAIIAPGPRIISVYDPKQPNRPILQERVDCTNNADIILSLQFFVPPPVRGQPQQPPQLKLVPIVLPKGQLPPGVPPGLLPPGTPPPSQPPANPPANPPTVPPAPGG